MANWVPSIGFCLVLSCLGCWLSRGQDVEKVEVEVEVDQVGGKRSGVSRPVNIFIINEKENKVANKSILAALRSIRERDKEGNDLGKVWSVEIGESSLNESLREVCNSWERAVLRNEGGDVSWLPDFILDTTRSGLGAKVANWLTATLGVPTLSAQYGQEGTLPYWSQLSEPQRNNYLVQVIPPGDLVPEAIRRLVQLLNARNAAIFFDHDYAMDRKYRKLLLEEPTRHLINMAPQSLPRMMEQLSRNRNLSIVNYFILGGQDTLNMALAAAEALNFTGPRYAWFMFSLDEGIRLAFGGHRDMSLLLLEPERAVLPNGDGGGGLPNPLLSSGFYYDLTILGVEAMKSAIDSGKWPYRPKHILCGDDDDDDTSAESSPRTVQRDLDFLSILKESYKNITPTYASISWAKKNGEHRARFNMSISFVAIEEGNVSRTGLGSWPAGMGLPREGENLKQRIRNAVTSYRVLTIIHPPFIMYHEENQSWYGFCIDLLEQIRTDMGMNFEYDIREVGDKKYGALNEEGNWNGMIKELIDKRADIALGTLWVTAEREKVVDFTIPYYDLVGLSIIMLKEETSITAFKYVVIFEKELWCTILLYYIFTSCLLWILDRWSPYSYQNDRDKYNDNDEEEEEEEEEEKRVFNLRESFWFCLTSMTSQGGGGPPKNLSGRVVAATWWLFCCVILVFYTANLSAYLTVLRIDTNPVRNLQDITDQYMMEYAPVANSAAHTYFKRMANIESKLSEVWKDMTLDDSLSAMGRANLLGVREYPLSDRYTKMYRAMLNAGLPASIEDALKRVRENSNFAYIEDSTTVRYLVMTNCDLVQIGDDFSRRPYAIAVQKGSPLKDEISAKILDLLNSRQLDELKEKWWNKNSARRDCDAEKSETGGISIGNVGFVSGVSFLGIIFASITLALEYYYYRHRARVAQIQKNPFLKKRTKVVKPMPRIRFDLQAPPRHAWHRSKFRVRF